MSDALLLAEISAHIKSIKLGNRPLPADAIRDVLERCRDELRLAERIPRKRDAERYRWLRAGKGDLHITRGPNWDRGHYYDAEADALIDAAISGDSPKERGGRE